MPRVLLTLSLLLLLVTSRVGAQDADIVFHLALTADVQGSLGFKASATGRVRELTLTCLKISGGAEVLCRDVERRYRAQYR